MLLILNLSRANQFCTAPVDIWVARRLLCAKYITNLLQVSGRHRPSTINFCMSTLATALCITTGTGGLTFMIARRFYLKSLGCFFFHFHNN